MSDDAALRELYQELILDHHAAPRNYGSLPGATHSAQGENPLCGDALTVELALEGDRVRDVRFEGAGCAISRASSSLMTIAIKGKRLAEVEQLFHAFHRLLTAEQGGDAAAGLGKLAVFAGVREFPMRVKCATLAWHTMWDALQASRAAAGAGRPTTTEEPSGGDAAY